MHLVDQLEKTKLGQSNSHQYLTRHRNEKQLVQFKTKESGNSQSSSMLPPIRQSIDAGDDSPASSERKNTPQIRKLQMPGSQDKAT